LKETNSNLICFLSVESKEKKALNRKFWFLFCEVVNYAKTLTNNFFYFYLLEKKVILFCLFN